MSVGVYQGEPVSFPAGCLSVDPNRACAIRSLPNVLSWIGYRQLTSGELEFLRKPEQFGRIYPLQSACVAYGGYSGCYGGEDGLRLKSLLDELLGVHPKA